MIRGRIALTLLTAALVAGPLSAQERIAAKEFTQGAKAKVMGLRQSLGLDSQHDFAVRLGHVDLLGQTHTRMNQLFQGVRVWGGEVITHVDAEGNDLPLTTELRRNISLSVKPTLTDSEILGLVHTHLNPVGTYAYAPSTELVVFPQMIEVARRSRTNRLDIDAEDLTRQVLRYRLAYHVHTELENGTEETAHTDFIVDAHTGAILQKWSTLHTSAAVGTGKSQWYGTVNLNTNYTGTTYELRDMTRGTGGTFSNNVTTNLNHATSGNGTIYSDADNAWGDGNAYGSGTTTSTTGATGQTAAVDQHHGMANTWDMFKNVFGRNGIDGTGKASYGRMHYSSNYDNAFWSDSCFCMTYGDGAPPSGSYGEADLDTVGHEMTHGVCATSANLTYSGESGGLNESNSDILGTAAEFYALGANSAGSVIPDNTGTGTITANYNLFENSWGHAGQALRYMYRPDKDGASPNFWYANLGKLDVHYSSGPMNRAWYFLAKGATTSGDTSTAINVTGSTGVSNPNFLPDGMTGIGNDKAARIWYRALTVYLTSSSNYAAARTACINAAKDLYGAGGAEEQAVWNAFHGINVGAAWSGTQTVAVAITPTTASVQTGATYQFTASVTGNTNTSVTWTATGGTVSSTGLFTAPATTGTYTVKATSVADATKSASAAVTVTSTPPPGSELILNGGFENGTTNWTATSGAIGTFTAQPAYAGTKNAWLGGNGKTSTEYAYQSVTIPSSITTATLSFYLHIDTAETTTSTAYDKLVVSLQNTAGKTLKTLATYSNLNKAAGYVLKTFDVSAYKGQTIRVYFKGTEDSSLQTSFVLDNVSLSTK
ncbi:MAG: M4 family metallopeptidase [Holophaga sp.]|nr:M4 family metallopeptidase [Holophaga sp.]